MEKVPLTIITGFLGSGKTTLVKNILKNATTRYLLLQSDFSPDMGIESTEFRGPDGEIIPDAYELPNGCICCSVRDSVVATLDMILGRQERPLIEYVLVETSGVADPSKLVESFWVDDDLESRVYLDGVITVVDAANFWKYLKSKEPTVGTLAEKEDFGMQDGVQADDFVQRNIQSMKEAGHRTAVYAQGEKDDNGEFREIAHAAAKQIAAASIVLLNRCDLQPDTKQIDSAQSIIKSWNPEVPVYRTTKSKVPPTRILNLHAFATASTDTYQLLGILPPPHQPRNRKMLDVDSACCTKSAVSTVSSHLSTVRITLSAKGSIGPACNSLAALQNKLTATGVPEAAASVAGAATGVLEAATTNEKSVGPFLPPIFESLRSYLTRKDETLPSSNDIEAAVGRLIWEREAGELYRYKGILIANGIKGNEICVLQGVGDTFDIRPLQVVDPATAAALESKNTLIRENGQVVFFNKFMAVGRNLDCNKIDAWFKKFWQS